MQYFGHFSGERWQTRANSPVFAASLFTFVKKFSTELWRKFVGLRGNFIRVSGVCPYSPVYEWSLPRTGEQFANKLRENLEFTGRRR